MGSGFLPYAPPVFERCSSIIHRSLLQYQAYQQNPDMEEPEKGFLVVALDLLSGLTQGLGMSLEPLINAGNPNLLSLITICLKHPQASVRQSAYALVGDMAMSCFVLFLLSRFSAASSLMLTDLKGTRPESDVKLASYTSETRFFKVLCGRGVSCS